MIGMSDGFRNSTFPDRSPAGAPGRRALRRRACLSALGGSPGFPVELDGVGEFHTPFFTERRTRGLVQCRVAGNPGYSGGAALLTHTKWAWRRRAKCVICEVGPVYADSGGQRCWIGFLLWSAI